MRLGFRCPHPPPPARCRWLPAGQCYYVGRPNFLRAAFSFVDRWGRVERVKVLGTIAVGLAGE